VVAAHFRNAATRGREGVGGKGGGGEMVWKREAWALMGVPLVTAERKFTLSQCHLFWHFCH